MRFHLLGIFSSLLCSITITFVHAQAQINMMYQNCSASLQCGNISNISYPFWGSNRPTYCGYPGFHINCINGTLHVRIQQLDYQILQIDTTSHSLTVARSDYLDTICPSSLSNTTLDQNLFNFNSDLQNITLYYDCPATVNQNQSPKQSSVSTASNEFNCRINNSDSVGYFLTRSINSSSLSISLESCSDSVIVPAFKSSVQFVESNPGEANLIEALNQGFGLQWIANDSLCDSCTSSGGLCGHNTTTNSFACYCPDSNHPFVCAGFGAFGIKRFSISGAGIGAITAAAVICSCVGCYCCCSQRRRFWAKSVLLRWKKTEEDEKIEAFIMNYQSLIAKRYSYWNINKITNSFKSKLGQGGFGGVYKGKLPDGRLVAVKVLNKSASDGQDFINEVATISRTSHVNIVNLLGFCFERSKRALVYEYMPNGSLNNYIKDPTSNHGNCSLEWKALYEIAIGIARGLEYLHRGCNTRIVHFDIKPHNILLDENFCPKISDFGLAKLCKGQESLVSTLGGARGTVGYIAPEVFMKSYGGVSYKSDVYSYGMMVLEMFGGKINIDIAVSHDSEIYFSDWIYDHLEAGALSRIHGNLTREEEETVRRMIIVGLWCIQTNPTERPSMTKVIEMLEGGVESLRIPPKPYLFAATSNSQPNSASRTPASLSSVYMRSKKDEEKEEEKSFSLAEVQ